MQKLMKKLLSIILICLTMNYAPKSLADNPGPMEKAPSSKKKICFDRPEIERYKTECDANRLKLQESDQLLQEALAHPPVENSFYQEKPMIAGIVIGAFVLGFIAAGAAK